MQQFQLISLPLYSIQVLLPLLQINDGLVADVGFGFDAIFEQVV